MASEKTLDRPAGIVHREFVGLLVLAVAGVVGLLLTRAAAQSNRRMHHADAVRWYEEAQRSVAASRPAAAVPALRRAVAINRDSVAYRLALAGALAASGEDESARQVLVSLRQLAPEDPQINLQLARLESRRSDLTAAAQYYQNALHGSWSADDRGNERRRVRIELIEYLLRHEQKSRALAELLVLSANLPDEVSPQIAIGRMFRDAGDPRRALDHFVRALHLGPKDEGALEGAAEAAFIAGDYLHARTYLRALNAPSPRLAEMQVIADIILTRDPLAPRLRFTERRRRLAAGVEQAQERIAGCSGVDDGLRQDLAGLAQSAKTSSGGADSDLIDQGVDLIGRIELAADQRCGAGGAIDQGWRAIAARHGGDNQ